MDRTFRYRAGRWPVVLLSLCLVVASGCEAGAPRTPEKTSVFAQRPESIPLTKDGAARLVQRHFPEAKAAVEGTAVVAGAECWRVKLLPKVRDRAIPYEEDTLGEEYVRVEDGRVVYVMHTDTPWSDPPEVWGDDPKAMIRSASEYAQDHGLVLEGWHLRNDMPPLTDNDAPFVRWSRDKVEDGRVPPLLEVGVGGEEGAADSLSYLDLSYAPEPQVLTRRDALRYAKVDWFSSRTYETVFLSMSGWGEPPSALWDVLVQERRVVDNQERCKSGWWEIDAVSGKIVNMHVDPAQTYSP